MFELKGTSLDDFLSIKEVKEMLKEKQIQEVAFEENKEQETKEENEIIRIHFKNAKEFIEHLKLLQTIDDEAWFKVTNEGLQYSQLDPSKISALFMKFKGEIENIKECKFSIYLRDFLAIISNEDLKQMNNKDLTFEIDIVNKKARILSIINIEGESLFEEEYNEYSDFPEPKAILDAEAEVNLANLLNAIKGFETVRLILEIDKEDRLIAEARKETISKKSIINAKIINGKNETTSIYDVNFLSNFLKKVIKLKKIANLRFSNKMPLNIKFETSIAEISYWLAPRVEE